MYSVEVHNEHCILTMRNHNFFWIIIYTPSFLTLHKKEYLANERGMKGFSFQTLFFEAKLFFGFFITLLSPAHADSSNNVDTVHKKNDTNTKRV